MNPTQAYYEENYQDLTTQYNSANVETLHNIFLEYLPINCSVLDIGFGSGRDLRFLKANGFNTYGLDSCQNFIENAKIDLEVGYSLLPSIDTSTLSKSSFDCIISVATIMHLSKEDILTTIQNLKSYLNDNGRIIISYSLTKRTDDEARFFEDLTDNFIEKSFLQSGFKPLFKTTITDGMNRNIKWSTEIYEL